MVNNDTFKQLALSFPEATEMPHFEKASFRIKNKIFATLDTAQQLVCLKLSLIDQSVFCAINSSIIYPVNNKWGKQGRTLVQLKKVKKNLLKEMLSKACLTVLTGKNTRQAPTLKR